MTVRETDDAIVKRYTEDLMSGRVFTNHARSIGSTIGYEPPTNRAALSHFFETVGKMTGESDPLMRLGQRILAAGYAQALTPSQNGEKAYQAAVVALGHGYFDTMKAASPEPGRDSDNRRDYTLAERLQLLAWMSLATMKFRPGDTGGLGWVADKLATELNVRKLI